MKNTTLLVDHHYFGNITYYKNMCNASYCLIEQYGDHKKKSFANRTVIAGANGKINLSIPLEKGRSQKTISKDVKICNAESWQVRHFRSIVSSYNNSPWFKYFSDDLADVFSKKIEFLLDWNIACLDWTLKILKMPLHYERTKTWSEALPGVLDLRDRILPDADPPEHEIRYPQVFENKLGFLPDLSILDLICCEGPKATLHLLKGET